MRKILFISTLMLSGRAMTIAFLGRIGGSQLGDPPLAWAMPLIGDALIGVSGLLMLALIHRSSKLWAWTTLVVWNSIGIWDALSAFAINQTNPWPAFFMLQVFGNSMFFIASAMHALNLWILSESKKDQSPHLDSAKAH